MLQAAGLVHVTASVHIVCMKMSNKRKQTALDLYQKIVISMKLKGTKTGRGCGGLQSVETNSKLDMTALLPQGVIMMMMMMIGIAFPCA